MLKENLKRFHLFQLLQTCGLDVTIVVTSPFQLIMLVMIGKCIITACEIRLSHTAQNLAEEIRHSLADKVVLLTTDNGQNIKNAITEELKFSHLGCVDHTLQLSIGKALQLTAVYRV